MRRLVRLGDLPPDTPARAEGATYDGAIVDGVMRFQTRHGLEPDGVIGRSTHAALRVPWHGARGSSSWRSNACAGCRISAPSAWSS